MANRFLRFDDDLDDSGLKKIEKSWKKLKKVCQKVEKSWKKSKK
jgi:hypothetical protein